MTLIPRPLALPAALLSALFATLVAAMPGNAGAIGDAASLAMSPEQAALDSTAGARVLALSKSMRPVARAADEIVVASRDADPQTTSALARMATPDTARVVAPAKLDFATLDALPRVTGGGADQECLAQAIYFESRGEPLDGQIAVAEVVLNRVGDHSFPKTVCGVTRQGAGSGRGCQFSYVCDGNSDTMKSAGARERSEKLAALMLAGRPRTVTDGAIYFHTRAIRPSWSRRMARTTTIGHHIFYRAPTQVAGG